MLHTIATSLVLKNNPDSFYLHSEHGYTVESTGKLIYDAYIM